MHYFQSINLLQTPEIPVYPGSLSNSNNNNNINGPGFDYFLNQQFDNKIINRFEDNQYKNNEIPEDYGKLSQNDILLNNDRNKITENK